MVRRRACAVSNHETGAAHPSRRGQEAAPQDAALASNQNIENNPMQSSMAVAGMDALSYPCENILTRRANQRHYSTIAPSPGKRFVFVPRGNRYPPIGSWPEGMLFPDHALTRGACAKPSACRPPEHFLRSPAKENPSRE